MTLENELKKKKENLKFFYQMAQEALDAKDLEQAIKISAKGLEETEIDETEEVEEDTVINELVILNTSIVKEDITIIKGVGVVAAEKLRSAGFHTVQSLADATILQLTYLPGIGQKTAQKIIEGANIHLSQTNLNDFPEEVKKGEDVLTNNSVVPDPIIDENKESSGLKDDNGSKGVIIKTESTIKTESKFPWFEEKFKIRRPGASQSTKEKSKTKFIPEKIDDEFDYDSDNEVAEDEPLITNKDIGQERYMESSLQPKTITQNTTPLVDKQERSGIESNIQESYNYSSQSNKTVQVQEVLQSSEKKSVIEGVLHTLQELGFHILEKVRLLKGLSMNSDLIALKVIHANEFLDLVLILPIKLNMLKGEVKVSDEQVKYIPFNDKYKEDGSSFRLQLDSTIKDLGKVFTVMRDDLINEGKLLSYLRTHLQVDISIEKSITKKNLFFRAGQLQYKLFIEPILLCNNEVGFLEKVVPFPYLKDINLHIINNKRLTDFLGYLEKKWLLLEEHSDQKSSLIAYEESYNQFLGYGKKLSFPFIGFGAVMLLLVLFQLFAVLEFIINIGYALFGIYTTSLAYLYIKFFKIKLEVQTEFNIPDHQKQIEIDNTRLILIGDEFTPEMMNQFIYECLGKNNNSAYIRKVEESFTKERLSKKINSLRLQKENLFEERETEVKSDGLIDEMNEDTYEEDEIINKYSSFLED